MGHETHLSAEQNRPQAPPRLPLAHGDQERPQDSGPSPRPWPEETFGLNLTPKPGKTPDLLLDRLKTRADFLRVQRGIRRSAPGLTLELCNRPPPASTPGHIRVGFTASRKVGNAVARNRAKRRLRAAAAALLPLYGEDGNDYVLVARKATLVRPWQGLLDDLSTVLQAAHAKSGRSNPGGLP